MEEFGAAFDELLVPLLREHGLVESDADAPETVEGVFSRLYEFDSPAALARKLVELQADPRLTEASRSLERDFESPREDGQLQPRFRILSSPAGPGRAVPAEPVSVSPLGAGRGTWRTFDVTNGLAGPMVQAVVQDRDGALWFATVNNSVSRYDGQTWTTYNTDNGLADNRVYSLSTRIATVRSGLVPVRASAGSTAKSGRPTPGKMGWPAMSCFPSCRTGKVATGLAPTGAA